MPKRLPISNPAAKDLVKRMINRMSQEDGNPNVLVTTNGEKGIVLQLSDGTVAACNVAAQQILGMTIDQLQDASLIGTPWQTIHPNGAPFPGETHPAMVALQTGQPCLNVEMGFYKPDGELVWLSMDAQPLFRRGETAPYAVTVTITPLSGCPETMPYAGEAWYRILSEAIPQLVWATTADGRNEYVNQQFCDFTGLSESELLDLDWLEIIHPDDRDRTRDCWLGSINSGDLYEIEYRFRRFDGVYVWFLGRGIPLRDDQGQIMKWFGTCTDIDTKKQTERDRLRLIEQERTARTAAEQANRIKDEFLAVVSHELRTPLNPILGWSKLLRSGRLSPERSAEALETIERNAQQQAQLIDDLLDVSRILRNKLTLAIAPVDLAMTVTNAVETVRFAAEAKSIQLRSTLSPIELVSGDAGRLQQIVWNLLSNAVKFTPPEGQIDVRLKQVGTLAQLQVIDTGKGIQPGFLPHLFEAFRQEDNSTTRQFGGLGLGLSIVQQLVELHGGTVTAESPGEGEGATFTVTLPIALSQHLPLPPTLNNQAVDLQGVRVLVIEDVTDSRDLVRFTLEQAGALVTAVASAQAALEQLTQVDPNVIISDIGLPECNGYELMQQIRRDFPQFKIVPAIALTAYATETDQRQALESGFQHHLAKPIDPEALIQTVATLIQQL